MKRKIPELLNPKWYWNDFKKRPLLDKLPLIVSIISLITVLVMSALRA